MTEIKISVELNLSDKMQAFLTSFFESAPAQVKKTPSRSRKKVEAEITPAPEEEITTAGPEIEPEIEPEPEATPVPEAPAPEAEKKVIKLEDLRPVMAELWGRGKKEEVARILEKRKAHFLKEISPEEYGALLADFNNALHADD